MAEIFANVDIKATSIKGDYWEFDSETEELSYAPTIKLTNDEDQFLAIGFNANETDKWFVFAAMNDNHFSDGGDQYDTQTFAKALEYCKRTYKNVPSEALLAKLKESAMKSIGL